MVRGMLEVTIRHECAARETCRLSTGGRHVGIERVERHYPCILQSGSSTGRRGGTSIGERVVEPVPAELRDLVERSLAPGVHLERAGKSSDRDAWWFNLIW